MILEFEDEKGLLDAQTRALMQTCSQAAQRAEGVTLPLSVFIRVTDDDEIRTINREQRGKDAATDVLSFPTVNYPVGKTAGACEALLREEFDPDTDACAIGDIVISMDHVRAQAAEYGHSERRECGYLLTHGLFHLMGYDHMEEEDKRTMRAMEKRAMRRLGLYKEEERDMTDMEMKALAIDALKLSYVPYSKYHVGACLLAVDGRTFQGANFENASYGATICAERCAASVWKYACSACSFAFLTRPKKSSSYDESAA